MLSETKLKFEPITTQKAAVLKAAFQTQSYRTCGFTVGSAIMWQREYNLQICEIDGSVILSAEYENEGHCFSVPVGGDAKAVIKSIYAECRNAGQRCIFSDVPEEGLAMLIGIFGEERCRFEHFREWDDYVYNSDDLMNFSGKKYAAQRNNVNKFTRLYPNAEFLPIDRDNFDGAFEFLKSFVEENGDGSKSGEVEGDADIDLMNHYFDLDLMGGMVVNNGKIIAISVGEQIGDTLFIHVEKGLVEYQGIYQFIVQKFAQAYAKNARFINREEDDGVDGLRKSKLSYRPIMLLKKYSVEII